MKKLFITSIFLVVFFLIIAGNLDSYTEEGYSSSSVGENFREISDTIKKGQTLFDIFKRYHLDIGELLELRKASADVYRLRNLYPGQSYKILVDDNDRVNSFSYWIDDNSILNITRSDSGFYAEKVPIAYEKRILYMDRAIEDNLISSAGEGKEGLMLALNISDIFAWDIDFTSDLRNGDTFRVIVEGLYLDGEFKKYGEILCLEFMNNGKPYQAYRFEYEGKADYYDSEGKTLRRAYLKAPLSFRRISSTFSDGRFHPILKRYRPHHGLDYAAPAGTPVSAIGSGTVVFSGIKGDYGKFVIIKHPNGYMSYYGHLSKIEKNIRIGVRAEQGQIIGYVGATGLATGPHLHYELRINDKPVNPLTVSLPRGKPIPANMLTKFRQSRNEMDSQLASINPPAIEVSNRVLRKSAKL
ncbi:MAG: peptidoglycan DD-metalloendopeptidase family protein [Nitrospirae bacterium]|nr:peptidoglycan DD-metalloendopeptidase family protein [Nitrospirota bacterium]